MKNYGNFNPEILKEIEQKGYHILNKSLNKGSYPNEFPKFPKLNNIDVGGIYVLRLFVRIPNTISQNIDSGMIDVKIIEKSNNGFIAEILTLLPDIFPIFKGQKIEIKKEEILYEMNTDVYN